MTDTERWFEENMRYFKISEFKVSPEKLDKGLLLALDELRHISKTPIIINCAYATSGHSPKSYHYTGNAVDFHFKKGVLSPAEQYKFISRIPYFQGIGWYPHWDSPGWHVDNREKPLRWTWVRDAYNYSTKVFKEEVGFV